jgi:hypothetical protein
VQNGYYIGWKVKDKEYNIWYYRVGIAYHIGPVEDKLIAQYGLNPRYDLIKHGLHSKETFEWGEGCNRNSAMQLAIAICASIFKDDARALKIYKHVYEDIIIRMPGEWTYKHKELYDKIIDVENKYRV